VVNNPWFLIGAVLSVLAEPFTSFYHFVAGSIGLTDQATDHTIIIQ
jgi:hypothetical protein